MGESQTVTPTTDEKFDCEIDHKEVTPHDGGTHSPGGNLVYTEDAEPVLHARTYMALFALFLLNFVQVVALNGPPSGVSQTQMAPPS